jgi:hypothetical protein
MIISRFDIFRVDKDGSLFWMGTADDVTRQQSGSRDFVLFDLRTGTKLEMKFGNTQQTEPLVQSPVFLSTEFNI